MRVPGWERRLYKAIQRAASQGSFCYGSQDCGLFVADAIRACTGIDYAHDLRKRYDSELSAARLIRQEGGYSALVTRALGREPVPALTVTRGDPVLRVEGRREMLGVCDGVESLFLSFVGIVSHKTADCVHGWRT